MTRNRITTFIILLCLSTYCSNAKDSAAAKKANLNKRELESISTPGIVIDLRKSYPTSEQQNQDQQQQFIVTSESEHQILNDAVVLPTCTDDQQLLKLEFMADKTSKWSNIVKIQRKLKFGWKTLVKIIGFRNQTLFTYYKCVEKRVINRIKVIDRKGDGLCCEKGNNGWYEVYFDDVKLDHPRFDAKIGLEQIVTKTCAKDFQLSKMCGGNKVGEDFCCKGYVCSRYYPHSCVRKRNWKCAGPNVEAKSCGATWKTNKKHLAKNCCPGFTCDGLKCVQAS